MNGRHAICLVVDGLRASALGTYGNTSNPTPQLDAIASRSAVVEWLWTDSPCLDRFYRGVWRGLHALRPDSSEASSLLTSLRGNNVQLRLVTDQPSLADKKTLEVFDNVRLIESRSEVSAGEIADTAMAQLCSAAIEALEEWHGRGSGSLTWIHAQGLFGAWDAPLALREALLDEEDPPATEFLYPPGELRSVVDPDVLLVHRTAYAAQVAVVDACLGALWQCIEELMADRETMVMLLGSRGFALGEHGSIGGNCCELFGERLHLPWLLHIDSLPSPRPRLAGLAQPADVAATLLDWFGVQPGGEPCDGQSVLPNMDSGSGILRELAVSAGDQHERAVRTPAWLLRQAGRNAQPQLFAKPDDRWEHNDVAVRCEQVVESLLEASAEFEQVCREGQPLPTAALDEELVSPSR